MIIEIEFSVNKKYLFMIILVVGLLGYFVNGVNPGHDADYVWIEDMNGVHKTLQTAIEDYTLGGEPVAGEVSFDSCSIHNVPLAASADSDLLAWNGVGGLDELSVCRDNNKVLVGISVRAVDDDGNGAYCDGTMSPPPAGDCGEVYVYSVKCCRVNLI